MANGGEKMMAIRHGHGSRRGCNAAEKAIETGVRQGARAEIRAALEEMLEPEAPECDRVRFGDYCAVCAGEA